LQAIQHIHHLVKGRVNLYLNHSDIDRVESIDR
jgi:hypothetical protein